MATQLCPPHSPITLQVPTSVRKDLERHVAGCTLVKEAATVAKYRVSGVAAALEVEGGNCR